MRLLMKKMHLPVTLLVLLVVCVMAPLAQSGRSGMRGYVAFEDLSYNDVAERKVHETELGVVGLFGVGETGAFTEPSAVAPDAGVNLVMTVDNSRVHGKLFSLQGSRIKGTGAVSIGILISTVASARWKQCSQESETV